MYEWMDHVMDVTYLCDNIIKSSPIGQSLDQRLIVSYNQNDVHGLREQNSVKFNLD